MPEQIKQYLTIHDLKLVLAVISIMSFGFVWWNEVEKNVQELQIRVALDDKQGNEQIKAVKELTKAVQDLNVTSAQLEVRLRSLESAFPSLRRSIEQSKN